MRIYKPQITRISARLASCQQNSKLRKQPCTLTLHPNPFHLVYSSHLAYISSLSSSRDLLQSSSFRTLNAIRDLHELSTRNGMRLPPACQRLYWSCATQSIMVLERSLKFFLQKVEGVLNFKFLSESGFQSVGELIIKLEKVLPIHVRIIFHNYVGNHGVLEVFFIHLSEKEFC